MEDFVTYSQAIKLKELGFNEGVLQGYTKGGVEFSNHIYAEDVVFDVTILDLIKNHNCCNDISAPTLSHTQKWLRDVKKTEIIINRLDDDVYNHTIYGEISNITTEIYYTSYEEALSDGITEAINVLMREKRTVSSYQF